MNSRFPYDLWLDLAYYLARGDEFWAGFWAAMILLVSWQVGWWVWQGVYMLWLRVRQFFQPTRRPGELPIKTGPSPFANFIGCLGAAAALFFLIVGLGALLFMRR